ncbi:MAG: Vitamin K-dependent gamma-carboxylase [Ilumatobacteraceae bacterium]|nr:Vitamin K-dependent gamma-carboxylase [Ilumatobacteraceae bacterium]
MLTATAQADTRPFVAEHVRWSRSQAPVHAASTAVFRISFGLLVTASMVRFVAKGWVARLYLEPAHHLTYARFEWVRPLPAVAMYSLMVLLALTGIGIAAGWRTRLCAAIFTIGFAYTELIEASLYLNHYWFVTLTGFLLIVLPTSSFWSVDARRGRVQRSATVPALVVWTLRAQIGVVYVFAGLAKINTDWLVHGQPLHMWLADRSDLPLLGPLLVLPGVALAASWFGLLFDTTIVVWLSWRRSRPIAYMVVVAFHVATAVLFRIGMFPWVMMLATPVFFDPRWPLRLLPPLTGRLPLQSSTGHRHPDAMPTIGRAVRCVLMGLAVVQIALPLRHYVEPGDVRFTEEGYYLSWRVMLTEKAGLLDFVVTDPTTGDTWIVPPTIVLTDWQATQAAIRPDLLLAAAHLVDDHYREQLGHDVQVRARSYVSINGHAPQPLADPSIDLSAVSRTTALHRVLVMP